MVNAKPNTILITGASRGLGLEFARQYAADGWHVVATCRTPERAAALKKLARTHGNISIFQLDVTDTKSIIRLARTLAKTPIDVLLNNAGIRGKGAYGQGKGEQTFGTHDYKVWHDVLAINTLGPLRVIEAFYKNLKKTKGKIINISSAGGSINENGTRTGSLAYQASKAALNMITVSTAASVAKDKITIVGICPGVTRTQKWHTSKTHPVTAEQSATELRKTIAKIKFKDSGRFMNKTGKNIPW